ncbi:hypothetical protein AB6D11_02595 [Vibrio splendidus]
MMIKKEKLTSTKDVDALAEELLAAWGACFPPAPSLSGRKKNTIRNMVCKMAGYQDGYQAFLGAMKKMPDPIEATRQYAYRDDGKDTITINSVVIDMELFDNGTFDYVLVDRDTEIETAIRIVAENGHPLYKRALASLLNSDDEYVWMSYDKHAKYVCKSEDPVAFNAIGHAILEEYSIWMPS